MGVSASIPRPFSWVQCDPEIDTSEFHALLTLLRIRNHSNPAKPRVFGTNAELLWGPWDGEVSENIWILDTRPESLESLPTDGDQICEMLLDRLAELLSTKQQNTYVTNAAMSTIRDGTVVTVARGRAWTYLDRVFLRDVEQWLNKGISDEQFREAVVGHYQPRIEIYAGELLSIIRRNAEMEPYFELRAGNTLDHIELEIMRKHARSLVDHGRTEDAGSLVDLAAEVVRSKKVRGWFVTPEAGAGSELWIILCLLARADTFLRTFHQFRTEKTRLGSVSIVALDPEVTTEDDVACRVRPLNIAQTLIRAGLSYDNETLSKHIGCLTTDDLFSKYFGFAFKDFELVRVPWSVHPEVQLICHLLSNGLFENTMTYLGCNMESCFLCSKFLEHLPRSFRTRGSLGAMLDAGDWTVPESSGAPEDAIVSGLKAVRGEVIKILQKPIVCHNEKEKQEGHEEKHQGAPEASSSQPITESSPSLLLPLLPVPTATHHSEQSNDPSSIPESECDICDSLTTRRCSVCHRDYFCSPYCESQAGIYHIMDCGRRPITSADRLAISCYDDMLPTDPAVRKDFGFDRVAGPDEESNLIGLYQGIVQYQDIDPTTIHEWQSSRTLEKNIIRIFNAIPERSRGGYFPWFMSAKDRLRLDTHTQSGPKEDDLYLRLIQRASTHLSPADQGVPHDMLEPKTKRIAFRGFALFLGHAIPSVEDTEVYKSFGFCSCEPAGTEPGNYEGDLGSLYNELVLGLGIHENFVPAHLRGSKKVATFTELWQALERNQLIKLMDEKGFEEDRKQFPYLQAALENPMWKVWTLRGFLSSPEGTAVPLSLLADYGFMWCANDGEVRELKEMYGRLWKAAGPVELQRAVQGRRLFRLAHRFFPEVSRGKKWKRLLRTATG